MIYTYKDVSHYAFLNIQFISNPDLSSHPLSLRYCIKGLSQRFNEVLL